MERMITVTLPDRLWDALSEVVWDSLPDIPCEGCGGIESDTCGICQGSGLSSSVWHSSMDHNEVAEAMRVIDTRIHNNMPRESLRALNEALRKGKA